MSEQDKPSGFFWTTGATEAGGPLAETEFFAAMDGAFKHHRTPTAPLVSQATIDKARADALRMHELANEAAGEWHRTRSWRIFKRHRLARTETEYLRSAIALEHTFGR